MKFKMTLLQNYLKATALVSPKLASKEAVKLFQKVRKKKIRQRETSFFATSFQFRIPYRYGEIDTFTKGTGKTVFLVHGWDSNAGSLSNIADHLVETGHKIVALNLPGHGPGKKNSTNYLECKEALIAVIKYINPQEEVSFVGHSFGSGIIAGAISELHIPIDQLFLVTTPNRIADFFDQFKVMLKLGDKTYKHMRSWADFLLKEPLEELVVAEKLKEAKFNHVYLIHDPKDKILPYSNSEQIHQSIPNSTLIPIEKSGHYRIIWKEEVAAVILEQSKGVQFEN